MKKSIFSLFFIFSITFSNAQAWCPPGATWYYDIVATFCDGYYKFEYIGDTTINSVSCKKITHKMRSKCPWTPSYQDYNFDTLYMYSDPDKVFYYKNNQFNLLYDFSVQVGDTMYVNGITNEWWGTSCDSVAQLKVDSIGTMNINSESLRYYCVQPLSNSAFSFKGRIVEKIGPLYKYTNSGNNYFLPKKNDGCGMLIDEEPENGTFRCYYDDNFPVVSMTQYSCDYTLGISELELFNIEIFPNPSKDIITVKFSEKYNSVSLSVFDLSGKIIYAISNISNENLTIDVSDFANGMYFVSINSNGITLDVQKLVIE